MINVKTHNRWYHGTSKKNAIKILKIGELKPGQQTQYHYDIPRSDAVYITSRKDLAEHYARDGTVLEVEPNPNMLIPDEDAVFEYLGLDDMWTSLKFRDKFHKKIAKAWFDYDIETWDDLSGYLPPPKTVEESIENLHWKIEDLQVNLSSEPAEIMKAFAEWLSIKRKDLAKEIIEKSGTAAHIGAVKIRGVVEEKR